MKKLTAEKCRELLKERNRQRDGGDISIGGIYMLQALEIALPILEQQERGEGWIEWGGGECPVGSYSKVETRLRCGLYSDADEARLIYWNHTGRGSDIIAYRIIPEQSTNQNGDN